MFQNSKSRSTSWQVQVHFVVQAPAEGLVKGPGAGEHPVHGRNAVNRPTADVLVERKGAGEHPVHAHDAGGVPRSDVLIKGRRVQVEVVDAPV